MRQKLVVVISVAALMLTSAGSSLAGNRFSRFSFKKRSLKRISRRGVAKKSLSGSKLSAPKKPISISTNQVFSKLKNINPQLINKIGLSRKSQKIQNASVYESVFDNGVTVHPFKNSVLMRKSSNILLANCSVSGKIYRRSIGAYTLYAQSRANRITVRGGSISAYFYPKREPGWKSKNKTYMIRVTGYITDKTYVYINKRVLHFNQVAPGQWATLVTAKKGIIALRILIGQKQLFTLYSISVKRMK